VSRVLLVTQQPRGYGEFRKPLVRSLYRRYVQRYRGEVSKAVAAWAADHELTILAERGLLDSDRLPPHVTVHYYDEESLKVRAKEFGHRNEQLLKRLWPDPETAPELSSHGVWLPDLLRLVRGLVLSLEVSEPVTIAEQVMDETRPERVVLVSGASVLERAARLIARARNVQVTVAAPWFLAARAYARFWRQLQIRDDKLRIREFLDFPRVIPVRSESPRVVFATCRPRHHFVVDPLAEAVRGAGLAPHVLASPVSDAELDAKLDRLRRDGIAAEYLSNYLPRNEAQLLARRYRPTLARLWRRIRRSSDFVDARNAEPVAHTLATPLLRDTVTRSSLVPRLVLEATGRALDALKPSAIVITSNRRYTERALALAARARRIPVLMFSGTLLKGRDDYQFLDVADRLLVIGAYLQRELVQQEGIPRDRISVVGDPRSNAARLVPSAVLRTDVARHFDLDATAPIVVFISKYVSRFFSDQEKESFYRTYIDAARKLDGVQTIVKVHPNEDLPLLQRQVADWGWPEALLTKDYDIHRLFGAADAAVMVTSMAGLEAMALGCPVVAVQAVAKSYEDNQTMPPYVSEAGVDRVDMGDASTLVSVLTRLLHDDEHRRSVIERGRAFAAQYIHPADGALAERLLAVIDDVRRESGTEPT
jgi:glycosyltransferase involved in cell wall biosynthesis